MKKAIAIASAILLSAAAYSAKDETVYGFEADGITYAVKGNAKVEVIRPLVKVYFGNVDIPAKATNKKTGETYNVIGIGEHAFASMDIDRVTTPVSVTYMVEGVFQGSRLRFYHWPVTVERIPEWAFADCSLLERISIKNNVTSIGSGAFYGCERLDSIEVPASVKIIDTLGISHCPKLTTIILNEGLETIGDMAFRNNTKLTELTIPSTVTKIGAEFMDGCSKLTTLRVKAMTPPEVGKDKDGSCVKTFKSFGKKGTLIVPKGAAEAYRDAFGWSIIANIVEE